MLAKSDEILLVSDQVFFKYRSPEILHSIKPSIFLSVDKGDHSSFDFNLNEPRTQELVVGFNRPCFVQELFNKKDYKLEQIGKSSLRDRYLWPQPVRTSEYFFYFELIRYFGIHQVWNWKKIEKRYLSETFASRIFVAGTIFVELFTGRLLVVQKFVGSSTQKTGKGSRCSTVEEHKSWGCGFESGQVLGSSLSYQLCPKFRSPEVKHNWFYYKNNA